MKQFLLVAVIFLVACWFLVVPHSTPPVSSTSLGPTSTADQTPTTAPAQTPTAAQTAEPPPEPSLEPLTPFASGRRLLAACRVAKEVSERAETTKTWGLYPKAPEGSLEATKFCVRIVDSAVEGLYHTSDACLLLAGHYSDGSTSGVTFSMIPDFVAYGEKAREEVLAGPYEDILTQYLIDRWGCFKPTGVCLYCSPQGRH